MGILDQLWNVHFWRAYGASYPEMRDFLERSQYWTIAEREAYHTSCLNRLLKTATSQSTFYRSLYPPASTISKPYEMARLPVITKADVARGLSTISIPTNTRVYEHSTSGSTGDPLRLTISQAAEALRTAGHQQQFAWWGLRIYDRSALLWGRMATAARDQRPLTLFDDAKRRLRERTLSRRLFLNVFDLSRASIRDIFRDLASFAPVYLRGYKSALLQLAELVREADLPAEALKLKLIVVTAEVLMCEERRFIEGVFQCPVADQYGAAEAGLFAFECSKQRMHVYEPAVYLATDAQGSVVVTEVRNDVTPLINYLNGDSVSFSDTQCTCQRTSRVIDSVNGRAVDHLRTESGESLSPYIIYYAVKELDDVGLGKSIQKYRVTQRGKSFDFQVVPDVNFGPEVAAYLTQRLRAKAGQSMEVSVTVVERIDRERSGKLRFFVREY